MSMFQPLVWGHRLKKEELLYDVMEAQEPIGVLRVFKA